MLIVSCPYSNNQVENPMTYRLWDFLNGVYSRYILVLPMALNAPIFLFFLPLN